MGMIRPLGAVTVTTGTPTPIFTGTVIAAVSFSITNNIATIVMGSLPTTGYNGPNGYPGSTPFDIHGGNAGSSPQGSGGQQVTLWGFATATYFNGKTVTVLDCNPTNNSFRFYFTNANVGSTADTGNTAAVPVQRYRAVRLECGLGNGTDTVYVGDGTVTSSKYMAALSLAQQFAIEIAGDNIPADRIFIDGTASTDKVQVTLIY